MSVVELIGLAARIFEITGVGTMVVGASLSLVMMVVQRQQETAKSAIRHFRERLGSAILLGLELLVAADIIRTVSERPTLNGVMVLGLIVLIRTFLSFTLAVELEGRWPWQRARFGWMEHGAPAPPAHPPPPEEGSRRNGERPAGH